MDDWMDGLVEYYGLEECGFSSYINLFFLVCQTPGSGFPRLSQENVWQQIFGSATQKPRIICIEAANASRNGILLIGETVCGLLAGLKLAGSGVW